MGAGTCVPQYRPISGSSSLIPSCTFNEELAISFFFLIFFLIEPNLSLNSTFPILMFTFYNGTLWTRTNITVDFSPKMSYCGMYWLLKNNNIFFLKNLYVSLNALSINSYFSNPSPPRINHLITFTTKCILVV